MTEDDAFSSGFIGEETSIPNGGLTDIEEISSSGHNRLFKCKRYGQVHILKALQEAYRGQDFYEQALLKEFNIGYRLHHPHICQTLGWEQIPEAGHAILLEYIDGRTLKDLIDQKQLTPRLTYKIIDELCSALQYLHNKQIVHRDLKPSNILITYNGDNVKLIDFGLSDCDDYSILKLPAGTRHYLAPEACLRGAPLDLRADIYSLGIIIAEMAAASGEKKLLPIARKCASIRPEQRYHSAYEVVSAINAGKKRHPIYRYIALGAAIVGIMAGGIWWKNEKMSSPIFSLPVYGNLSGGMQCRQILAEERIRIARQVAVQPQATITADSTALLQRLRQAMEEEFPLPQQQQSTAYRNLWSEWMQEVSLLYSSTILPKLPQEEER